MNGASTQKSSPTNGSKGQGQGNGQKSTPLNLGTAQAGNNVTAPQPPKKNKKKKHKKTTSPSPPPRTSSGVPTPSNPSFSFALPGAAPIGVPNFFIDSFRIPPFLLPIYQAAGIQYDVPWQVLAAINEIETDYGRNLSVSTRRSRRAGCSSCPSTWKRYGIDANGDGVADPYNPVDAIFSAARYLHAAGASKNIGSAVFSYNHAGWYVQSVMLRAKLIGGMPKRLDRRADRPGRGPLPGRGPGQVRRRRRREARQARVKTANAAVPMKSDPDSHRPSRSTPSKLAGDRGQRRQDRQDRAEHSSSAATSSSRTPPATSTRTRTWARSRAQYPVPKPQRSPPPDRQGAARPDRAAPSQAATAGTQQSPATPSTAKATSEAAERRRSHCP